MLRDAEKIGLVGANGSGKTTLLRILAGADPPDAGEISRARGARVGFVAQEATSDEDTSLRAVMESAFAMVRAEERAIRDLENAIADAAGKKDEAAKWHTELRKLQPAAL